MEEVNKALAALFDGVADVLVTGLGEAATVHDESRETQAALRGQAMTRALLGRQLSGLVSSMSAEVQRRTEPRYASYLQHPRYGHEQHIDEAEAADRSLNKTLLRLLDAPTPWNELGFWAAAIRVRAITAVIGPACVYPPVGGGSSVRRRRREMTAADVPAPVADVLLRAADREIGHGDAIAELQALETTEHNIGAVVTKLVVLLEHEDGIEHLNRIAGDLRRALFRRDQRVGGPRSDEALISARAADLEEARGSVTAGTGRPARKPVQRPGDPVSDARSDTTSASTTPASTAGGRAKAVLERLGSPGSTLAERLAASHAQMRRG